MYTVEPEQQCAHTGAKATAKADVAAQSSSLADHHGSAHIRIRFRAFVDLAFFIRDYSRISQVFLHSLHIRRLIRCIILQAFGAGLSARPASSKLT